MNINTITYLTWISIFMAGLGLGYWAALLKLNKTIQTYTDTTVYTVNLIAAYVTLIEEKNALLIKKEETNLE